MGLKNQKFNVRVSFPSQPLEREYFDSFSTILKGHNLIGTRG
jgi:hypothetical protein